MKRIGIIGYGNMGSCIGQVLAKNGYTAIAFDSDSAKLSHCAGASTAANIKELIEAVDVVVLAVKPQDFGELLKEIKNSVQEKLIVSIAAGITTKYIENYLGAVRIVRVMPNMAARVGQAMTCLCKNVFVLESDTGEVQRMFALLGQTALIDEAMMNAATAVSGSGPGYFFDLVARGVIDVHNQSHVDQFVEALSVSASHVGFNSQQARLLANATTAGSVALIENSDVAADVLVKQVASKGGTTEAGLQVLYKKNPYSLDEAVRAAAQRAGELSK